MVHKWSYNILVIARNAAKQQAIQDRMDETFFTNGFLPNFAFSFLSDMQLVFSTLLLEVS